MMATSSEIEKLAYDLWEKDGRPHGRDAEFYFAAERMLADGQGGVAVADAPKKRTSRAASAAKPKAAGTRTKKQA